MDQLLGVYTELVRGANDEQIVIHLSNLVKDAAALAEAVNAVVNQAKARASQPAQ